MDLPAFKETVVIIDDAAQYLKKKKNKTTWGVTRTVDDGQGQDAPGARAGHPVKELPDWSTGLFLQSDQHLDQHQTFDTAAVQTQKSVHTVEGSELEELSYLFTRKCISV